MKMIFLVDGDNHLAEGLKGIDLLTAEDTVLVFYGKGQSEASVRKLCGQTDAQVHLLESVRSGKNSIDFQIITELGVLVGRGEAEYAYVISQDKGYESAMSALRRRYSNTFQEVALRPSIESCLRTAYLLRPQDKNELVRSLEQTFGPEQGVTVYRHLKALFVKKDEEDANVTASTASAAPSPSIFSDPVSRRRKRAEKALEEEEPFVVLEGLEEEESVAPKKRTHRGGRRHHKRS